ncbi:cysteine hydrolase family protein [Streptomyces sp. CoH27]|uniref:cysteine hydrolase family protein n=1 Tax=Streptomyces sp. CoH27 TaxID=2875763 RepID=UPI001CD41DF1|nr:isochorismatase family cysteine hydrolase [Streptomyces sp. CoH27]
MTETRAALILVDLQQWILGMHPWEPTPAAALVGACARLRAGFTEVVLVRHLHAGGSDGGPEAPAGRLHERVAPGPGDLVVVKHGLDAFEGTDLAARLAARGISDVVIAGLSTAHAVAATARTALASGYRVTLVSDATTTVSAAEQDRVLGQLAAAGAAVRTAEEILSGRLVTGS